MNRRGAFRFALGALAASLPTVCLLGWPLATADTFAFRDVAHFYRPLYEYVNRSDFLHPPLWNPYDNLGTPVADEATSAIFYPCRLVLQIPTESFAFRLELYILLHGLLASVGGYWLARVWRCSQAAAILAGMAYGCGGGVIFQYCNVVFLVGAAWLPFALGSGERFLKTRQPLWAFAAAASLAFMALGGDAQAAYIAGMALGVLAVVSACMKFRAVNTGLTNKLRAGSKQFAVNMVLIAVIAVAGGLLALPQVYASFFAARQSPRIQYEQPRTAWEAAQSAINGDEFDLTQLVAPPPADSHQAATVDFSVGPWHWAEFIWPRFSGSLFPIYRRWTAVFPAEDRVWTPSLYFGLLPFLLAVCALFHRSRTRREYWLKLLALGGLLTCLGWFGVGWLVNEIYLAFASDPDAQPIIAPALGGLYWLFTVGLPGFIGFRYPAKFLVITTLALSLLAARGFDLLVRRKTRSVAYIALGTCAASLLVAIAAPVVGYGFAEFLPDSVPPDDTFGPFDPWGAAGEVAVSGVVAAGLAVGIYFLLRFRQRLSGVGFTASLLTLVAFDLLISQHHLIATAPEAVFETSTDQMAGMPWSGSTKSPEPYVLRQRASRVDPNWRSESSVDRVAEVAAKERQRLFGRHNLPTDAQAGSPMIDTFLSVRSTDHLVMLETVACYATSPNSHRPAEIGWLFNWREDSPASELNMETQPFAFTVFQADHFPPLKGGRLSDIIQRTEQTLFPHGSPRDFTHSASVECDTDPRLDSGASADASTIEVQSHTPERIELRATLSKRGMVVIRQSYNPDWRVTAVSQTDGSTLEPELLRANRVLQGFVLPPGEWNIRLAYEPTGLIVAFRVSLGCWLAALLAVSIQPALSFVRREKR